jgi:hypothetical protein
MKIQERKDITRPVDKQIGIEKDLNIPKTTKRKELLLTFPVITLNVNSLKFPIKRHRSVSWNKSKFQPFVS